MQICRIFHRVAHIQVVGTYCIEIFDTTVFSNVKFAMNIEIWGMLIMLLNLINLIKI